MTGTCTICGCTDDSPCLGAAVYASVLEAAWARRLVPDGNLLPAGKYCYWLDGKHTICSAHAAGELALHGFAVARHGDGFSEFGLLSVGGGDPC
ncbi:MAG: hypothetical protein JXA90_03195 [Planctomycetes bacterium]|nr:hypothetical protein [Planctomycetota bacterium]